MDTPANRLSENFFAIINPRISSLEEKGVDIIRLDIGNPDLPPADHIIKKLTSVAWKANSHGYQSHRGSPELREAWADMYLRVHGVHLDPDGILPLFGSKEGVFHLSSAILNPGDIVLIPDPGYQTYAQGAKLANAKPVLFSLNPENGFLPEFSGIPKNIAQQAKLLWLNYPNNPTGAVAPFDFFVEAVAFCCENDIILCHDAAYSQVTFNEYIAPSVLEVPDSLTVAVEFNTLSKSHNMAGWRVGAAVGRQDIMDLLFRIKTHADSGHFLPIIEAAVAALSEDQTWLIKRNNIYMERRDVLISSLQDLGFKPYLPKGSIYVWCPLPEGWMAETFVLEVLENAHVSFAPGTIFGSSWDGYIRISLTQSVDRILEGMERLKHWL